MGNEFIGVGWRFPFQFQGGRVDSSRPRVPEESSGEQDVELILQSLRQIINTKLRERFFNREFGSSLHDVPFAPNDEITETFIHDFILIAIAEQEPRVSSVQVLIRRDVDRILTSLDVTISETNNAQNRVFPFKFDSRGSV